MTGESPYTTLAQAIVILVGTLVVLYILKLHFVGGVCKSTAPLRGKTVPSTGATCNRNIGKETTVEPTRTSSLVVLRQTEKVRSYLRLWY